MPERAIGSRRATVAHDVDILGEDRSIMEQRQTIVTCIFAGSAARNSSLAALTISVGRPICFAGNAASASSPSSSSSFAPKPSPQ